MGEENAITLASMEFNTLALIAKAEKEKGLKSWMDENLEQGIDRDWEYTHIIWKKDPPPDKRDWSAQLLDPGTAKIMGYMGVRPDHIDIKVEFDAETGRGRAQMKSLLKTILPILYLNIKTGEPIPYHPAIAEGVGSCTTSEKRFRVKWENYTGRGLIADGGYTVKDLEDLKRLNPDRLIKDNPDIKKCIFFMPDPAAAGADNSLLKMAAKRSESDAVFQIPGVAQRFSQELDIMKTELDEKGNRVPSPVQSEEEPQEEDWSDELEGKIKAMGKSPTWIRSQADDIIAKSDGLITTRKAALSVLLKRLNKEKTPAKRAGKPVKVQDFAKPVELQLPEWGLDDELNRAEDSWDDAKKITEAWMKEAGFNLADYEIAVDGVKIQVTPIKAIPVDAQPDVNGIMLAAGFSRSKGIWRLNRSEGVG